MKRNLLLLLLLLGSEVLSAQSFAGGWHWISPDSTEIISCSFAVNRQGGTYGEFLYTSDSGNRMDIGKLDMLKQKGKSGTFRAASGYSPGVTGTVQLQMLSDTTLFFTLLPTDFYWLPDSVVLTKYRPESEVWFLNRKLQ